MPDYKEKKKKGADWKMAIPGYGAGKAIYNLMKNRGQMPERIEPSVRKIAPVKPVPVPAEGEEQPITAEQKPPEKKKKKKRGGVGGVLDQMQERKRRMQQVQETE